MSTKRRKKKMAMANPINMPEIVSKKKRNIIRKSNRLASMSKDDWKEANEVSRNNRGINGLSFNDIFGEGK